MKLISRVWNAPNRAIVFNAGSMMSTTAVNSALGFIYWWLAARQFAPEAVGLASAAISSMTLLGTIGMLGLGTLLIGELPRQPDRRFALIATALLIVASVGTALGVLFALLAPFISDDLSPLAANPGIVLLFGFGASFTAVTLVLDQALIGLLRGALQFWRNVIFAVVKLGLLAGAALWVGTEYGLTIYATWVLGLLVSLLSLAGYLLVRHGFHGHYHPQWGLVKGLGGAALSHHLLNVALLVSSLLLPLVVTAMLSATMTAYFYTASMVSTFVIIGPTALTTVLYAVGAADPQALAQRARFTLGLALVGGIIANLVLQFAAAPILSVFGQAYVDNAAGPLRILGLAVFPLIIREHYVAVFRVYDQITRAIGPVLLGSLITLAAASMGAQVGGLVGLSIGAVLGLVIETSYMAPVVYRLATRAEAPKPR